MMKWKMQNVQRTVSDLHFANIQIVRFENLTIFRVGEMGIQ